MTSAPPTKAVVDNPYIYMASATDKDSDNLTYSLKAGPYGMTVDCSTGKVTWTPAAAGKYTAVLNVSDGNGGGTEQNFTVNVSGAVRPRMELVSPPLDKALKGNVSFMGTATSGTRTIACVQMRIDKKEWNNATGVKNWTYDLNTRMLKNGTHIFEFRAFDGKEHSDVLVVGLKVDNSAGGKGKAPIMDCWTALSLVMLIFTLTALKRQGKPGLKRHPDQ
jgi:hypothetical protein